MSLRRCLVVCCGLLLVAPAARGGDAPGPAQKKETFWVIPHTHWEGAVFKTREEYLTMGLPNILKAMRLLKEQPGFKFTLDQVAYVRPFLERYPEEEAAFRRYIAEGRLQLAGAMDVMPDVNMPGGETLVRQIRYGKGYYREKLGVDVTTAWLIDTFGHHAQMPQLLTLGGYKTFWFSRGVPKDDHPSEFLWEGIDGTRITSFWLPYSYGLMYGAPRQLDQFKGFAKQRFDMLARNSRGGDRVGLAGVDVSEPEEQLAPLVQAYSREKDTPIELRMAVPADFEAVVAKRKDLPVFKGELNPIFQGTYSSRIELKEWMRRAERLLITAEKLSVLASWLGTPADTQGLWRAWEPVLFNETHDLSSGVMTDHVYADTVRSYAFSERLANELIDRRWQALVSKIDTQGDGIPVVVFNTLGWRRSDIAELDLGFGEGGVSAVALADEAGRPVPVQILESTRYGDGGLKTARVAFEAHDIPALGYRTYHVVPQRNTSPAEAPAQAGDVVENAFYRITIDPASGALTSLRVKSSDWELLAGHANVVAREQDRGDLWELYKGLDGGSKFAMTTRQAVPHAGQAKLSDEQKEKPGTVRTGPVLSEFHVAHPFDTGRFATTVRVYQGLRRIDVRTSLVNNEKFVRYQALFPTTIKNGKNTHEIPFGAIERPSGIEFPAQNWVDHGDGQRGLAVLNIGLPGNVTTDGTMMVSLLRAHTLGAYGFGGGYEPGMTSESGYQLGREHTVRYALLPHEGDWRDAGVYRAGLELNHPLLCRTVAAHAGSLPKRWGLLEVSAPNVVVSALGPGHAGTAVLRVYEATGRAASGVKVKLEAKLASAHEVNLLEDRGHSLPVEDNTVRFDLHPYEIKTIALRLDSRD